MKLLALVIIAPTAMALAPYPWGAVIASACIAGIVYFEARRALGKPDITDEQKRTAKRLWKRIYPLS